MTCRPWIENLFIRTFFDKDISIFYPLVPLFVQFTDFYVAQPNVSKPQSSILGNFLESSRHLFRDDVLYLAVIQHAVGPLAFIRNCSYFRNWVIVSAGGWGNVPIPLLKNEMPLAEPSVARQHLMSFVGRTGYKAAFHSNDDVVRIRSTLVRALEQLQVEDQTNRDLVHVTSTVDPQEYCQIIADSVFVLAPRGIGATSFRLYESLQVGRVPVYFWSGIRWLPYKKMGIWGPGGVALPVEVDENLSATLHTLKDFGLAGASRSSITSMNSTTTTAVLDLTTSSVLEMEANIRRVRDDYFTFRGVLTQLIRFIANPESSALHCEPKPQTHISPPSE
jgi:hypothetical protein